MSPSLCVSSNRGSSPAAVTGRVIQPSAGSLLTSPRSCWGGVYELISVFTGVEAGTGDIKQ